MKSVIALLCLLALAFGQHQHVCLPHEFTTDQASYDPARHDVFISRMFFSVPQQHTRLDIDFAETHDHPLHERFTLLHDYRKGVFYDVRYDETNKTATCHVGNLTGKLTPRCLSTHAELRGRPLIGAVLHCDNWIERVKEHQERIFVDIMMAADINVPIRMYDRSHEHASFSEFWNFLETVHHDAFIVPQVCLMGEEEYIDETLNAKETLLRVMPHLPTLF